MQTYVVQDMYTLLERRTTAANLAALEAEIHKDGHMSSAIPCYYGSPSLDLALWEPSK